MTQISLPRTAKAMSGNVTFREALMARLHIIQPTLQQVTDFVNSRNVKELLTPGFP